MVADPMTLWQNYYVANTIEDGLQILAQSPDDSHIIAGGTDLLLDLQQGRRPPVQTLVDVTQISEMNLIEIRNGELFIGAAVSHNRVQSSQLVLEHCTALAEASAMIGGPQVRNVATIGGNVAHALPAADGTIALLALDAVAEISDLNGSRRVPLEELFLGPGQSTLEKGREILTGFYLRLRQKGQSSSFQRIMRPQGVAIAILNMAVWLHREADIIQDVRIVVGPSGPVPRRIQLAGNLLKGQSFPDSIIFEDVYEMILEETSFRTSRYRATRAYREKMAGVLLECTLKTAFLRASRDDK